MKNTPARYLHTLSALLLAATAATAARADTLVERDGTRLTGRILQEDPAGVTFETNFDGLLVRQRFARANIRALSRDSQSGPAYCILPLTGTVGTGITADTFRAAVDMAKASGAKYILIEINSPGGLISEMAKVLEVIRSEHDVRFIAYVKGQAMSAASIIAIACPRIFMAPGSTIGAAVPFKFSTRGLPEDVDRKFFSAFQALIRAAAEMGGHSPLFGKAMSDISVQIVLRKDAHGKPQLAEVPPGSEQEGDQILKEKGKILTFTANEAHDAGLSSATVFSEEEIRKALNLPPWHAVAEAATAYLKNHAQVVADNPLPGSGALSPDAAERLAQLAEKKKSLEKKLTDLDAGYHQEMTDARSAYLKAMNEPHPPAELEKFKKEADEKYASRKADIYARYHPQVVAAVEELRATTLEVTLLSSHADN